MVGIQIKIAKKIEPAVTHHNEDKIVFITPCNVTIEHSGRRFKAKWRTCYRGYGNEVPLWPIEEFFAREKTTRGPKKGIRRRHPWGKPEGDSVYIKDRIYVRCMAPWMPL